MRLDKVVTFGSNGSRMDHLEAKLVGQFGADCSAAHRVKGNGNVTWSE